MGEKGSFKNLIKDFMKIIKKKKKKQQDELSKKQQKKRLAEQKKKVGYSKPKIIATVVLGYTLNLIVYSFTKKKDDSKKVYIEQIVEIEKGLSKASSVEMLDVLEKRTITVKRNMIANKKFDFKLGKRTDELLQNIDIKKQNVQANSIIDENNIKGKNDDVQIKKQLLKEEKILEVVSFEKQDEIDDEKTKVLKNIDIEVALYELEVQVKRVNNIDEIKKLEKNLEKIKKTIIDKNLKNEYEKRLNVLSDKLTNFKDSLNHVNIENKKNDDVLKNDNKPTAVGRDFNEVKAKNNKLENKKVAPTLIATAGLTAHLANKVVNEIGESLTFSDEIKDDIELNLNHNDREENITSKEKKDILFSSEVIKNTKPLEKEKFNPFVKKEVKVEKSDNKEIQEEQNIDSKRMEQFYISTKNIKDACELVEKDYLEQTDHINKLKMQLLMLTPEKKRKSLVSIIGGLVKKVNTAVFSLAPLALFKNKLLGGVVGSVILNHRIKKVRSMTTDEDNIYYYSVKDILKQISDEKNAILINIDINVNTIFEINNLKKDIMNEVDNNIEKYPEVLQILNDLNKLEQEIISKNEKMKKELEKTKKLEEKGKVKIKKIAA